MPAWSLVLIGMLIAGPAGARELGQGPVADPLPPLGPRLYQCFQFPDERLPVIDGDLSDWELVGEEYAQDTYGLIEYNRQLGRGYDLHNLDVRVRTGYNVRANRIYMAVEYWDDFHNLDRVVRAPSAASPGNDDIFELVVDADNSGGEASGFKWDFGDGEQSTEKEPLHRYQQPGRYTVTLEARNGQGSCRKRKLDYVILAE
jgi:hypothetical protein